MTAEEIRMAWAKGTVLEYQDPGTGWSPHLDQERIDLTGPEGVRIWREKPNRYVRLAVYPYAKNSGESTIGVELVDWYDNEPEPSLPATHDQWLTDWILVTLTPENSQTEDSPEINLEEILKSLGPIEDQLPNHPSNKRAKPPLEGINPWQLYGKSGKRSNPPFNGINPWVYCTVSHKRG